MTRSKLENILKSYEVKKPRYKDENIENQSFPEMLFTFRRLINNQIPPTQKQFVSEFLSTSKVSGKGITSRLQRAYLSFVREFHLGFLLEEEFDTVIYDIGLDVNGTDFLVKYKEETYHIHAYVDTKSSRYWREVKNSRHNFYGNHIDLPLDLRKARRIGKFLLYRKSDVKRLRKIMDSEGRS